jgi:hypothetical protein
MGALTLRHFRDSNSALALRKLAQIGKIKRALRFVAQTLLVAVRPHALTAFVFRDF